MKLIKAVDLVDQVVSKMSLNSGRPIFNEWLIIDLSGQDVVILYYTGPRSSASQKKLKRDMRSLEDEMSNGGYTTGQFYFSPDAAGTLFDAFIVAGQGKYIIFNNTTMTMTEITADAFWNKTQVHFVELSEKFHMDALV